MSDMITAEAAQGWRDRKSAITLSGNQIDAAVRTVIALHAQLADAKAAQAMVVERAANMIEDNVRHAKELGREIWAMPDLRALADTDGLTLVQALRAERDAAVAEVARVQEDRAYVIGANDGWDAAVEQGEASPAVGKAMVRFWKRMAETHNARAETAEAERDRLAAANAALEARLANGLKWCDLMDGPVSKSQFVNGQATAAQQIRAALAAVQADARREGGE